MTTYTSPDPFNRPVPLQSLANESEGQWMWNRPPEYPDPMDFVLALEEKLNNNEVAKDKILDMLLIGATIEDVVNTTALAAFSQGKLNPDAAEIAKLPLATMIMDMAEEAGIEFKIFSSTPQDKEFSDDIDKLNLIRETNPEMFNKLTNEKDIELEEEEEKISSFMKMEN
tara:strand:+ start:4318 stop:4827 length:510 start_codon:yes stop_codon:yes gene_type:complete